VQVNSIFVVQTVSRLITMATYDGAEAPRKRMMTYGKAIRRRIPDHNFTSFARRSQPPAAAFKESELLQAKPPSGLHEGLKQPMQTPKRPAAASPSSASPVATNIFDVPSSDDETTASARRFVHKTTKPIMPTKSLSIMEALPTEAEGDERRKRMKLSPVRRPLQYPSPAKPITKQPISAPSQASKNLHRPLDLSHTSTTASKTKPSAPLVRLDLPTSAQKPKNHSATPKKVAYGLQSPSKGDLYWVGEDLSANYISPKGLKIWKSLLDPAEKGEADVNMDRKGKRGSDGREAHITSGTFCGPSGISNHPHKISHDLPRRRLIDSLVEQTVQHDDIDEDILDSDESKITSTPAPFNLKDTSDVSRSQSLIPDHSELATVLPNQGFQNLGPKYTYGRQRSMLAEHDLMQELALEIPSSVQPPGSRRLRGGSIPALQPLQSFCEEEDNEGAAGIRSVHELRQAGANNRFLDEVEDLLERIGSPTTLPSSMRRSGLLDFASKIKDKEFLRKFRANGVEQRLFVHLGQETDLIAGFMMVSVLTVILVDMSIPHMVAQLRRHGITRLLIRLLECQTGITTLSRDRKSNMSKVAQSLVSGHQDFLLGLHIWEDLKPIVLTPRTVALKCLELMIRQTREAGNSGDIISKELTTNLFSIVKCGSGDRSWDLPSGSEAIDFFLALSALESHSITARIARDETIWISDYLPIISETLEVAITRPVEGNAQLQALILRLTLNVTNNNPKASDVFAREELMAVMGQAIVSKFKIVSRFLTEEDFSITMDQLILILGVMINLADWSSLARESLQSLEGKANDPLGPMIQLFVDNQARTSEVRGYSSTFAHY
jgi:hypothetical protein